MLSPATTWTAAAARAAGEPRLLVEIKPTILYDEITREDWGNAESGATNVDTTHPSGELRLATTDVTTVQMATTDDLTTADNDYTFLRNKNFEDGSNSAVNSYSDIGQFIQTVTVENGFRLSKLRVGARAREWIGDNSYNHNLIVRLFANLTAPEYHYRTQNALTGISESGFAAGSIYNGAELIWDGKVNYGDHVPVGGTHVGNFVEFDISNKYIYVAGGNRLFAIDLMVDHADSAEKVSLYGSESGGYGGGTLLEHDHNSGLTFQKQADLAFQFIALGYESTGTAVYELDMGEAPAANLSGELELKYVTPASTSVSFRFRESTNGSSWTDWATATDGTTLNNKRYVQVEATLNADTYQLQTPRILGVRASYKRSDKFTLASQIVEGYPTSVYGAPEFGLEADPLEGTATTSDTSSITLLDPDGMLSDNIIGEYNIKNDEIVFSVGWDGLATSDYLKIKTLWIESWSVNRDGTVTLRCYDQQRRIRATEIPSAHDASPDTMEQIHFDGTTPGTIKTELLQRAGVRPSKINTTNMAALTTKYNWSLVHSVEEQTPAQKILEDLNKHLLSFEYLDESGKWVSPFINFSATPVATIQQEEILDEPAEGYNPGWERMRNVVAVFFNGEGTDEADYSDVSLIADSTSMKAFKEVSADRLLSEWIPDTDDAGSITGMASTIAKNRRALQTDGLRVISFATRLDKMHIQVGDHIYYYAAYYDRPGTSSTNPLTCFVLSKNIDADLSTITWTALVLLDAEQSAPTITAVEAPSEVTINDNADRTVDITWTASTDDGTSIARYDVFIRRKSIKNWGALKTYKEADGSATYTVSGYSFTDTGTYDFGVRAISNSGRMSAIATALAKSVTDTTLAAPTWSLVPDVGGWKFIITAHVDGAQYYRILQYLGPHIGWQSVGSVSTSSKVKAGGEARVVANPTLGYGTQYGRFKLATVSAAGEGTASDEQADWSLPYQGTLLASSLAPTLPAEAGTYPTLVRVQNVSGEYKYQVTLKITGPVGYEDLVARYEIERRDNGSGDYGSWENVGNRLIDSYPAPKTVMWVNADARLKPTVTYQWRARAVAMDGTVSAWTDSLSETVTAATTPPAQPTVSVATTALVNILTITGGTESDFAYFKIEGKPGAAAWQTLVAKQVLTVWVHNVSVAGIAVSWSYRVTAYNRQGIASTVSAATAGSTATLISAGVIAASTILTSNLAFTPVMGTNVIATINASEEGLNISADRIAISGSCTFSSGYNPTTKLNHTGGAYKTASSGARVLIFEDANTGIRVTDGTNDVFKVLVGGTDVGDVIIGSTSGQYMKWDKSAGTLSIVGGLSTTSGSNTLEIGTSATGGALLQSDGNYAIGMISGIIDCLYNAGGGYAWHVRAYGMSGDFKIQGRDGTTVYLDIDKTSLDLLNGAVLKVGTNQVVGAQGAAVADATDAASVITQLNLLLARCRAHGLIAT